MFGYDDDELEDARQKAEGPIDRGMFGFSARALNRQKNKGSWWLRAFIVGVELSVLVVGLSLCFMFWLTTTTDGIRFALERIIGDAPVAIEVDEVRLHPDADFWNTQSWSIVVKNLDIQQTDKPGDNVRVQVRYAVLPLPNVFGAWYQRRLVFEEALVIGLDILKNDNGQPKTPTWEPKKTALGSIAIKKLYLWDGSFRLDAPGGDGPDTTSTLIYGDLNDMRYEPGPRLLSGDGTLFAKRFTSGAIEVGHIVADAVAKDGNLVFDATSLAADGEIDLHGTLAHLERRPAVALDVTGRNLSIAQLVEGASGTASPVYGRVSGTIEVRSGGEIPRGAAWMEAQLTLTNGHVPLTSHVGGFVRDLLRLAPWTEINDQEQMVLGQTRVSLRLERGAAIIHELRSLAANDKWIEIHGVVDQQIDLVVRFVPDRNPESRAGFGFTIAGAPGDLKIGLAGRHELLPSVYADDNGDKLSREERRERRRAARTARREAKATEEAEE